MRISSASTTLLWAALAGSITLSILSGFSWPTLLLIASIVLALSYWFSKHQDKLRAKYESDESVAAVPGPYDKQIWRHKPMVRDLAPGLLALGLASFYFAYTAAYGHEPTKFAKLIHHFFGVSGVVAFWALLGVVLIAKATETIIGSRAKK